MRRAARFTEADVKRAVLETEGGGVSRSAEKRYPYLHCEKTRHGKIVYYLRQGTGPRVRVYDTPGTATFPSAYKAALEALHDPAKRLVSKYDRGGVYFILSGNDKVKIGYSGSPGKRLATLQTATERRLKLYYVTPGDQSFERELHKLFESYRIAGEWFWFSIEIKDWIKRDHNNRIDQIRRPK